MMSSHYFSFLSVRFSLIYVNRRSEATPLANMIEEKQRIRVQDFKANLVLFARNTQFYNRISIGKVDVANGSADKIISLGDNL